MSERETDRIFSRETCEDPHEERLHSLFATAYPPLKLTPSLRQQVADEIDRRNLPVARPARCKRPLFFQWGMAAAAGVAVLLAAALGLAIVRPGQHRSLGQQAPSMAQETQPERAPRAAGIGPQRPMGGHTQPMVRLHLPSFGATRGEVERPPSLAAPSPRKRNERVPRSVPVIRPRASTAGDLDDANDHPEAVRRQVAMPRDEWDRIEAGLCRAVRVRDDFVRIPFPRVAATSDRQVAEAVESYKREAAIVDSRLSHAVTIQQKATPLSDLCEHLRADTGIQLAAGSSVADEKVTLLCKQMPLREVMRQLSRPFGYAWTRSGKAGEYRYELIQDLRSQLLEEELRNRDRNAALLAFEREMDRFRPYLNLSPDEALARSKTAPPAEKKLLETFAGYGWGVIQMYFRLSPQQLASVRAGQELRFSAEPEPGQQPLPPDVARGVLQSLRGWGTIKSNALVIGFTVTNDLTNPEAVPLTASPVARAGLKLSIRQGELGQFGIWGDAAASVGGKLGPDGIRPGLSLGNSPYAVGINPRAQKPENRATNGKLARDTALRPQVTLQPQPSCGGAGGASPGPSPLRTAVSGQTSAESKVSTADVLQAVHRATGLPIVSDYYTRLYKPEAVAVRNQPLFDALNQIADVMRLRWNKEGSWLQFRSTSYYHDRLKEVPNRLLTQWASVRRQHGMLPLDKLLEIVQLPDTQLDGAEMAEGASECFGLTEWDVARNLTLRPHLRYLATFTPEQLQMATSAEGLPFTRMSLAQQQQFIANGIIQPLDSPDVLAGAVLRVEYTQPGEFQWQPPARWLRWVYPLEPGPQGRRALMPPLRARTREAVLQAARRIEPQIREGLLKLARYHHESDESADQVLQRAEIVSTSLDVGIAYIPGTSNRVLLREVFRDSVNEDRPL